MTTTNPIRLALGAEEHTFASFDGAELFYRVWRPARDATGESLLIFHRGHEYSGRFDELIAKLGVLDRGVTVFAWDARGHGKSPGERGWAPSFMSLVRDVDCFVRHVRDAHAMAVEEMSILAHSVGSVVVGTWVHDYAPPIKRLVMVAPALRVKLYVPFALSALRLRRKFSTKCFVKSYVSGKMLTHDAEQARSYDTDPLISRQIAVNILLEMHDTATRLMADAWAIGVPTMILAAGSDWVVRNSAIRRFFAGLSSARKEYREYPGFYHAILCEAKRDEAIADVRRFLERAVTPAGDTAAQEAASRAEYERLKSPLFALSPKAIRYGLQRAMMQTAGRLSQGIRIGYRAGFDSGESLDHVYRNTARGVTPLGRLIDRSYLKAPGWEGIRIRRGHVEELLDMAIARVRASGRPVRIVDIAAGPGRYMIETLRRHAGEDVAALVRDFSLSGLAEGRAIAEEKGVRNIAFEQADGLSEESVAAARVLGERPTIGVVSGLYELFPDNRLIEASLRGYHRALAEGGYLVYTNQPWHPQVEMIARALPNREGKPWVMRRRCQAEMDRLVREAGFAKLETRIDSMGIFTVSLARRV